jgi:DGQHR domain-containing protein
VAEFKYKAIRVMQRPDAIPFFVTSITAEELLDWADVPRKKEQFKAGYQRPLDEGRQEKIKEFIELSANNIIPGSIIVNVAESSSEVSDESEGGVCTLTVHTEDSDWENALKTIASEMRARLSDEELLAVTASVDRILSEPSISAARNAEEEFSQAFEEPGFLAGEEAAESDSASEAGNEDRQEAESQPPSYLAQIASEVFVAEKDVTRLPEERLAAVRDFIMSHSKPGRILDGQHRVFGAKEVNAFPVFFPVTIIRGLPDPEQVFHFYVLNNKAKALTRTQLRLTVATSLSNSEIRAFDERLIQAGVKAETARLTHRINTEATSPFKGLVDFGLEEAGSKRAFIPENVMHNAVCDFLSTVNSQPDIRPKEWREDPSFEYRLARFYAFWDAIRETYPTAWQKGIDDKQGQLFMKVILVGLPRYFVQTLVTTFPYRKKDKKPPVLAAVNEIRDEVEVHFTYLPEGFFTKPWGDIAKGLDTGAGMKTLLSEIGAIIGAQGKNLGNRAWFKKSKS